MQSLLLQFQKVVSTFQAIHQSWLGRVKKINFIGVDSIGTGLPWKYENFIPEILDVTGSRAVSEQAKIWHGGRHISIFELSAIGFQQWSISEGKASGVHVKLNADSKRKTGWSFWPILCVMILQSPANACCKSAFSTLRQEASHLSVKLSKV